MNKTIYVKFTNGFGNNIFQYAAARLLAERIGVNYCGVLPDKNYYARKSLEALGINFVENLPVGVKVLDERNFDEMFWSEDDLTLNQDICFFGYFEDYRYYINEFDRIRGWFPEVKSRQDNDLLLHIRTGDRLFMKNEFYVKPMIDKYLEVLQSFEFDNMHIVTDMPVWKNLTAKELQGINFHYNVPPNERVTIEESVKCFNDFFDGLSQFNPIVKTRKNASSVDSGTEVFDDFMFIRTFNQILFEHNTMCWWASAISDAKKIGVYKPWRRWKNNNKNLGQVPLDNWMGWE